MKTIKIMKFSDNLISGHWPKLIEAAQTLAGRTGYTIEAIHDGFEVSGFWQGAFLSEQAFAKHVAHDLAISSGILFDCLVE
jgi:hypothetical protein